MQVANAIAAFLLYLREDKRKKYRMHTHGTRANPHPYLLHYVLSGKVTLPP